MKNSLLSILAAFAMTFSLSAQTIAPDFTATDIDGVEHNLYEYLDAGKVVILDVSATWCGPCWSFHQAHYLEDIHQAFGPDGTDEVVVLWYEGDASTTNADLLGTGSNTLGDWTEGVTYPMIDPPTVEDAFLDVYAPLGFPTVNIICPDSKEIIADVYDQDLRGIVEQVVNCGTIKAVNDLGLTNYTGEIGTCDGDVNLAVEVSNTGFENVSDFEVTASVGGTQIGAVTYNQVLAAGAVTNIDFGTYTLATSADDVTFNITNDDIFASNNEGIVTVSKAVATDNTITVRIEADEWTTDDPTTWSIEDGDGNVVVQGAALVPFETFEETIPLSNLGCHVFVIEDGFGDGLETSIRITDSQDNVIFENSDFGSEGQGYFDVQSISGIEDILETESISLYPTPAGERLNLEWTALKAENALIQISNTAGQQMISTDFAFNAGKNILPINTSDLTAGVYFMSIQSQGEVVTKRFVKQ